MATGKIKKQSTPTLTNQLYELEESRTRATLSLSNYRSIALNSGLYALIAETSSNNYNGRSIAIFRGDSNTLISGYDMMPQTLVTPFDYREHVQFLFVPAGETKTIELMYWDTNSTGARHIWRIVKLMNV